MMAAEPSDAPAGGDGARETADDGWTTVVRRRRAKAAAEDVVPMDDDTVYAWVVRRSTAFLHLRSSGPLEDIDAARAYLDAQWVIVAAARIEKWDDRDSAMYRARAARVVTDALGAYIGERMDREYAAFKLTAEYARLIDDLWDNDPSQ